MLTIDIPMRRSRPHQDVDRRVHYTEDNKRVNILLVSYEINNFLLIFFFLHLNFGFWNFINRKPF